MKLLFGVLMLMGCEKGVDVSGVVIAPPDVQQLFSTAQPGLVRVNGTAAGVSVNSAVMVLCEPTAADLSFDFSAFEFGCAEPGTAQLTASVSYLAPNANAPCGEAPAVYVDTLDPVIASASGDFEAEVYGIGNCKDGSVDAVELRLAVVATP